MPGTHIEVRNHFDDAWSPGFVIEAVADDGYTVRRQRDRAVLPTIIAIEDIRPLLT